MKLPSAWWLWPFLAAAVLARIYFVNPGLLNLGRSLLTAPQFPAMTLTIQKLSQLTPVTWMWRSDETRTGFTGESLRLPLKQNWETAPLNFGIHNASKSSPAVDADGVFVGADSGWFYSFDHSGRLRWKILFSGAARGVHGSAVLDQENVYIGAYNGKFYCLDKKDGRPRWIAYLADAIGSSAVIDGEFIYVSAETGPTRRGILYKLRRADGKIEWQSAWMEGQIHSSPALSADRKLVILGSNNSWLTAFSTETGYVEWRKELGGEIKGAPAVSGDVVFAGSWSRKLTAVDAKSGDVKWEKPLDGISGSSPVIFSAMGLIVITSNQASRLYAFTLRGEPLWSADLNSALSYGSATGITTSAGPALLVTCGKSHLCAYRARDGRLLQKLKLAKGFSSTPAAYDGAVYLSLEKGGLVRLDSALKR